MVNSTEDAGMMVASPQEYAVSIIKMVDGLGKQAKSSQEFSDSLESSILELVDKRSKALLRAEKEGVYKHAHGASIFTKKVEESNHRIAELRSEMDGRPVEEHLTEIHQDDKDSEQGFFASLVIKSERRIAYLKAQREKEQGKPKKGFFESKIEAANAKIAELKKKLGKDVGDVRDPRQHDELQTAKAKEEKLSPEEKIKRTRDRIRLTELKLQAYRSLSKVLGKHIEKISEEIKKNPNLSQGDIDKLNKFKDAIEKFNEKTKVLAKEKDGLNKEQQENLKSLKIKKYRDLEEKMKSKRRELAAAQRALKDAENEQNYTGFVLPGDFLKIIKEEQERAAEAMSDQVESDIKSLAAEINAASNDKDPSVGNAKSLAIQAAKEGESAVSKADMDEALGNSLKVPAVEKDDQKDVDHHAKKIEDALFGGAVNAHQIGAAPVTPITAEVKARKEEAAKNYDPNYYGEMRNEKKNKK